MYSHLCFLASGTLALKKYTEHQSLPVFDTQIKKGDINQLLLTHIP